MLAPTNDIHTSSVASYFPTVGEISGSSFSDDGERSKALLAAYALVSRLETPWETILRLSMGQVILEYSCPLASTSLPAEAGC